jgi:hypothetical protein
VTVKTKPPKLVVHSDRARQSSPPAAGLPPATSHQGSAEQPTNPLSCCTMAPAAARALRVLLALAGASSAAADIYLMH